MISEILIRANYRRKDIFHTLDAVVGFSEFNEIK
jgi:hypothetical protein